MLGQEVRPGHHGGHDELAAIVQVVPGTGEVDGVPDAALALGNGSGSGGHGEHGRLDLPGDELGADLGGISKDDLHVLVRVQAVLREQVAENVLRVGPLAGGIDGLALQILHGLDSRAVAPLQDVEHTLGAQGQDLHIPLGLVIQVGGHVGGHHGDVVLSVGGGEPCHHLVVVGGHGVGVVVDGVVLVAIGEQLGRSNARGAGEHRQAHVLPLEYLLGRLLGGLSSLGAGASSQAQGQGPGQHRSK